MMTKEQDPSAHLERMEKNLKKEDKANTNRTGGSRGEGSYGPITGQQDPHPGPSMPSDARRRATDTRHTKPAATAVLNCDNTPQIKT
ncbi:uncharacterized protein AB9W97_007596 isoform 1-T8 [Spinachia spinachia]